MNPALPPVIGLFGASGAGKSTVARELVRHGYKLVPMSCVLKDMLRALGFTDQDLEGDQAYRLTPQKRLGGMSPREVAQTLGTQWARNIVHPDLLVNAVCNRLQQELAAGHRVVVDGMRFPNEWQMAHRLGGQVWTVRRRASEQKRTWFDKLCARFGFFPRIHESEYHWPDAPADFTFGNEHTEAALRRTVGIALKLYSQKEHSTCAGA